MPTWSDIKTICQTIYARYVNKGFIEMLSGNPTELAILIDLIHGQILDQPFEWNFCKEIGTITATGATTYDLATLFPDFHSIYQVYGINDNQDHPFAPNYEANIVPADGWSIRGNTLVFTGTAPASGTFKIQYKSKYLVKSAAGVRQQYLTDDTDYSVVPSRNLLIYGVGEHVEWKADEASDRKQQFVNKKFEVALNNLLLSGNIATNQTRNVL